MCHHIFLKVLVFWIQVRQWSQICTLIRSACLSGTFSASFAVKDFYSEFVFSLLFNAHIIYVDFYQDLYKRISRYLISLIQHVIFQTWVVYARLQSENRCSYENMVCNNFVNNFATETIGYLVAKRGYDTQIGFIISSPCYTTWSMLAENRRHLANNPHILPDVLSALGKAGNYIQPVQFTDDCLWWLSRWLREPDIPKIR